ncbi:CpsD/CapB family tyrosine-protein kinase [Sphaerobacter sp.]|uniref:CpsD/CapB family tyrosine-protein kinase n=1 Tax=Sphaerobacter sp. TaxID=2099654 RepID=UPI001D8E7798|nr:CpsD/CapB family tyrosine-protein kinase [Sphaerobacter sp.]MBX5445139.1 CpsD/CapB family tyrosine-protein kinase [Sphaerobacter sp.]
MSQIQERAESQTRVGGIDLAIVANPASAVAEAYRSLRSTVKFARFEPAVRSLAIADAGTGGQHTDVAANLAAALALGGDSVVLVDADFRRPRAHELFRLSNDTGLAEWLAAGDAEAPLPLIESGVDGLTLLPAGHAGKTGGTLPADLLGSNLFARLLARLRDEAAFVVVNTPPLPDFGDALAVAPRVDAVLLLVRSGKTKRAAAQRARESLDRVGARLLGVVLTDTGSRRRA